MIPGTSDNERINYILEHRDTLNINFLERFGKDFDRLSIDEQRIRVKLYLNKFSPQLETATR